MEISLGSRTEESVRIYFEKAQNPAVKAMLPQKAKTAEEAVRDYEETLLPGAASFGRTVFSDGRYVGDVWCYCIAPEDEPNAMLSYCIFEEALWNLGIATEAVRMFLREACAKYHLKTVGAFTYADNTASWKVLEKNGFTLREEFAEDGRLSRYYQLDLESFFTDTLTADFSDPLFQAAFRHYFSELGLEVNDWDGLFSEMNGEGDNEAYVRTAADGSFIGFIQFKPILFTSWFFEETCGFIREFWIAEPYRNCGHGTALLGLAETRMREQGISAFLLTTDTAESFYLRHGYRKAPAMKARNGDPVFIKRVQPGEKEARVQE